MLRNDSGTSPSAARARYPVPVRADRGTPGSRPWCDGSHRAGPPGPMLIECPIDQRVEAAGALIPLDPLVP